MKTSMSLRALLALVSALALVGSLSGCGQKGPLYIPQPAKPAPDAQTQPVPPQPQPDNKTGY